MFLLLIGLLAATNINAQYQGKILIEYYIKTIKTFTNNDHYI